MTNDDTGSEPLRYHVRLMVKHPSIDPNLITDRLGLTPHRTWLAGTSRTTPVGRPLSGLYKESYWGYSHRVEGNRYFSSDILKMIGRLEAASEFVLGLVEGGGSVEMIINLPGSVNIGDTIPWSCLERLAALKIGLGFEVFPNFE
jgi:Domain of unknown function (DUF4279)